MDAHSAGKFGKMRFVLALSLALFAVPATDAEGNVSSKSANSSAKEDIYNRFRSVNDTSAAASPTLLPHSVTPTPMRTQTPPPTPTLTPSESPTPEKTPSETWTETLPITPSLPVLGDQFVNIGIDDARPKENDGVNEIKLKRLLVLRDAGRFRGTADIFAFEALSPGVVKAQLFLTRQYGRESRVEVPGTTPLVATGEGPTPDSLAEIVALGPVKCPARASRVYTWNITAPPQFENQLPASVPTDVPGPEPFEPSSVVVRRDDEPGISVVLQFRAENSGIGSDFVSYVCDEGDAMYHALVYSEAGFKKTQHFEAIAHTSATSGVVQGEGHGLPELSCHTSRFNLTKPFGAWRQYPLLHGGTEVAEGGVVQVRYADVLCSLPDIVAFDAHYNRSGSGKQYTCFISRGTVDIAAREELRKPCRTIAEFQQVCATDPECVGYSTVTGFMEQDGHIIGVEIPYTLHSGQEDLKFLTGQDMSSLVEQNSLLPGHPAIAFHYAKPDVSCHFRFENTAVELEIAVSTFVARSDISLEVTDANRPTLTRYVPVEDSSTMMQCTNGSAVRMLSHHIFMAKHSTLKIRIAAQARLTAESAYVLIRARNTTLSSATTEVMTFHNHTRDFFVATAFVERTVVDGKVFVFMAMSVQSLKGLEVELLNPTSIPPTSSGAPTVVLCVDVRDGDGVITVIYPPVVHAEDRNMIIRLPTDINWTMVSSLRLRFDANVLLRHLRLLSADGVGARVRVNATVDAARSFPASHSSAPAALLTTEASSGKEEADVQTGPFVYPEASEALFPANHHRSPIGDGTINWIDWKLLATISGSPTHQDVSATVRGFNRTWVRSDARFACLRDHTGRTAYRCVVPFPAGASNLEVRVAQTIFRGQQIEVRVRGAEDKTLHFSTCGGSGEGGRPFVTFPGQNWACDVARVCSIWNDTMSEAVIVEISVGGGVDSGPCHFAVAALVSFQPPVSHPGSVLCPGVDQPLDISQVCDGRLAHCPDGSDEIGCTEHVRSNSFFNETEEGWEDGGLPPDGMSITRYCRRIAVIRHASQFIIVRGMCKLFRGEVVDTGLATNHTVFVRQGLLPLSAQTQSGGSRQLRSEPFIRFSRRLSAEETAELEDVIVQPYVGVRVRTAMPLPYDNHSFVVPFEVEGSAAATRDFSSWLRSKQVSKSLESFDPDSQVVWGSAAVGFHEASNPVTGSDSSSLVIASFAFSPSNASVGAGMCTGQCNPRACIYPASLKKTDITVKRKDTCSERDPNVPAALLYSSGEGERYHRDLTQVLTSETPTSSPLIRVDGDIRVLLAGGACLVVAGIAVLIGIATVVAMIREQADLEAAGALNTSTSRVSELSPRVARRRESAFALVIKEKVAAKHKLLSRPTAIAVLVVVALGFGLVGTVLLLVHSALDDYSSDDNIVIAAFDNPVCLGSGVARALPLQLSFASASGVCARATVIGRAYAEVYIKADCTRFPPRVAVARTFEKCSRAVLRWPDKFSDCNEPTVVFDYVTWLPHGTSVAVRCTLKGAEFDSLMATSRNFLAPTGAPTVLNDTKVELLAPSELKSSVVDLCTGYRWGAPRYHPYEHHGLFIAPRISHLTCGVPSVSADLGTFASTVDWRDRWTQFDPSRLVLQAADAFADGSLPLKVTPVPAHRVHAQSNDTLRVLSVAMGVDSSQIRCNYRGAVDGLETFFAADDQCAIGFNFGESGDALSDGDMQKQADRYVGIAGTSPDIGHFFSNDEESYSISLWVRPSRRTSGFAFVVTDHLEHLSSHENPIVTRLWNIARSPGGEVSIHWNTTSAPLNVYASLFLDGRYNQIQFIAAHANGETAHVVWHLAEMGGVLFNDRWHHLAVIFHRHSGHSAVRLMLDGRTDFNSDWSRCINQLPLPIMKLTPNIMFPGGEFMTVSGGGVLYVGMLAAGIQRLRFEPAVALTRRELLHRRGTLATRVYAASSKAALCLSVAVFLGVSMLFAVTTMLHEARSIRSSQYALWKHAERLEDRYSAAVARLFAPGYSLVDFCAAREWLDMDVELFNGFIEEIMDAPLYRDSSRLVLALWRAATPAAGDAAPSCDGWDTVVRNRGLTVVPHPSPLGRDEHSHLDPGTARSMESTCEANERLSTPSDALTTALRGSTGVSGLVALIIIVCVLQPTALIFIDHEVEVPRLYLRVFRTAFYALLVDPTHFVACHFAVSAISVTCIGLLLVFASLIVLQRDNLPFVSHALRYQYRRDRSADGEADEEITEMVRTVDPRIAARADEYMVGPLLCLLTADVRCGIAELAEKRPPSSTLVSFQAPGGEFYVQVRKDGLWAMPKRARRSKHRPTIDGEATAPAEQSASPKAATCTNPLNRPPRSAHYPLPMESLDCGGEAADGTVDPPVCRSRAASFGGESTGLVDVTADDLARLYRASRPPMLPSLAGTGMSLFSGVSESTSPQVLGRRRDTFTSVDPAHRLAVYVSLLRGGGLLTGMANSQRTEFQPGDTAELSLGQLSDVQAELATFLNVSHNSSRSAMARSRIMELAATIGGPDTMPGDPDKRERLFRLAHQRSRADNSFSFPRLNGDHTAFSATTIDDGNSLGHRVRRMQDSALHMTGTNPLAFLAGTLGAEDDYEETVSESDPGTPVFRDSVVVDGPPLPEMPLQSSRAPGPILVEGAAVGELDMEAVPRWDDLCNPLGDHEFALLKAIVRLEAAVEEEEPISPRHWPTARQFKAPRDQAAFIDAIRGWDNKPRGQLGLASRAGTIGNAEPAQEALEYVLRKFGGHLSPSCALTGHSTRLGMRRRMSARASAVSDYAASLASDDDARFSSRGGQRLGMVPIVAASPAVSVAGASGSSPPHSVAGAPPTAGVSRAVSEVQSGLDVPAVDQPLSHDATQLSSLSLTTAPGDDQMIQRAEQLRSAGARCPLHQTLLAPVEQSNVAPFFFRRRCAVIEDGVACNREIGAIYCCQHCDARNGRPLCGYALCSLHIRHTKATSVWAAILRHFEPFMRRGIGGILALTILWLAMFFVIPIARLCMLIVTCPVTLCCAAPLCRVAGPKDAAAISQVALAVLLLLTIWTLYVAFLLWHRRRTLFELFERPLYEGCYLKPLPLAGDPRREAHVYSRSWAVSASHRVAKKYPTLTAARAAFQCHWFRIPPLMPRPGIVGRSPTQFRVSHGSDPQSALQIALQPPGGGRRVVLAPRHFDRRGDDDSPSLSVTSRRGLGSSLTQRGRRRLPHSLATPPPSALLPTLGNSSPTRPVSNDPDTTTISVASPRAAPFPQQPSAIATVEQARAGHCAPSAGPDSWLSPGGDSGQGRLISLHSASPPPVSAHSPANAAISADAAAAQRPTGSSTMQPLMSIQSSLRPSRRFRWVREAFRRDVVCPMEWRRYMTSESSAVALLYAHSRLTRLPGVPLILFARLAILVAAMFPASQAKRLLTAAVAEVLFGVTIVGTVPFTAPQLRLVVTAAVIHQFSTLGLLAGVMGSESRRDDVADYVGPALVGVTTVMLLFGLACILHAIIGPHVAALRVRKGVGRVFAKLRIPRAAEAPLFMVPLDLDLTDGERRWQADGPDADGPE